MKSIVISGFPGIGKSYLFNNLPQGMCSDSDSSKFDKKEFPQNYMEHIKSLMGKKQLIFVSSHEEVRDALVENNIEFVLVYPQRELKEDYLKRYEQRGSPEGFIKLLDEKWDEWMDGLENQKNCTRIVLKSGEYLKDVVQITKKK